MCVHTYASHTCTLHAHTRIFTSETKFRKTIFTFALCDNPIRSHLLPFTAYKRLLDTHETDFKPRTACGLTNPDLKRCMF